MMMLRSTITAFGLLLPVAAFAQSHAATPPGGVPAGPGVVARGSSGVMVDGLPAARGGDPTTNGAPVTEGSPNVFINGKPAARVGDRTGCGGVIVQGSSTVFVNGRPLARAGDGTSC